MSNQDKLLEEVNNYYSSKIRQYGATPQGVDWNSDVSQNIRFEQLSKIIDRNSDYSLLDFGSGYGALYSFLKDKLDKCHYTGYDISKEMIAEGVKIYGENKSVNWKNDLDDDDKYDYVVASGIFNVKMELKEQEWDRYIFETLQIINSKSIKGFAFNMLTSYSDKEYMKSNLFYAHPEDIFKYCKNNFSKQVALLHDYNLYEFTVLIKKG